MEGGEILYFLTDSTPDVDILADLFGSSLPQSILAAEISDQRTIEGRKPKKAAAGEYVYQGIAARPFRRVFNLADYSR